MNTWCVDVSSRPYREWGESFHNQRRRSFSDNFHIQQSCIYFDDCSELRVLDQRRIITEKIAIPSFFFFGYNSKFFTYDIRNRLCKYSCPYLWSLCIKQKLKFSADLFFYFADSCDIACQCCCIVMRKIESQNPNSLLIAFYQLRLCIRRWSYCHYDTRHRLYYQIKQY